MILRFFLPANLKLDAKTQRHHAATDHLKCGGLKVEFEVLMALVAVLDRTVGDDFDAEGNEPPTDHDEPWVVEFVAKSDGLCQESG